MQGGLGFCSFGGGLRDSFPPTCDGANPDRLSHRAQKVAACDRLMAPSPKPRPWYWYAPFSDYTSFDHFHRELAKEVNPSGSDDITPMYHSLANSFLSWHPLAMEAVGQMATEAEGIPFTIIAGLEAGIPDVNTRRALEIHVVGAASRELSTRAMAEEILHHFTVLRELHIHYIGPDANVPAGALSSPNHACGACTERGSNRRWSLHRMEYHRFIADNPARKPDLIVGLNTGWSEIATESWASTLDTICALRTPAVFTAYSCKEAQLEADLLRSRDVDFVVEVQDNRWKGVIPIVNKGIQLAHGVLALYNNNYWYVFRGRQ
ncbi:hypothetical protein B0H17DRAFT_567034 [Mycena rosella]|uniref:Mitochondrial splicing suppressor 51-like C-terminal domain-containing protein n=1 Tax=Mycena rosella TaxID=1033263 RepID=A0AAD7BMZ6_MYCRO|nr:hypothetical protein B0H17DRAFT_567034 [Mycena rosella]